MSDDAGQIPPTPPPGWTPPPPPPDPAAGYPPPAYGQPGAPPAYGQPGAPPAYGQPGMPPAGYGLPPGYPMAAPKPPWYKRRWVWVTTAVVVALIIIGTIFSNHASGYELASKIREVLAAQPGITSVTGVSCPKDINTDQGHNYVCTGTVNGRAVSIDVTFDKDKHFLVTKLTPTG